MKEKTQEGIAGGFSEEAQGLNDNELAAFLAERKAERQRAENLEGCGGPATLDMAKLGSPFQYTNK